MKSWETNIFNYYIQQHCGWKKDEQTMEGLALACRGLMTSCLPLVNNTWSQSGPQHTPYTGIPVDTNVTCWHEQQHLAWLDWPPTGIPVAQMSTYTNTWSQFSPQHTQCTYILASSTLHTQLYLLTQTSTLCLVNSRSHDSLAPSTSYSLVYLLNKHQHDGQHLVTVWL